MQGRVGLVASAQAELHTVRAALRAAMTLVFASWSDGRYPGESMTSEAMKVAKSLVFLVGAGAVRGAWDPVLRAVRAVYPNALSGDDANVAMANLVYNVRWWQFDADRRKDAESQELLQRAKQPRDELCQGIATQLRAAEAAGDIKVRDGFDFIWNRYIGGVGEFFVVTTNWDLVLDRYIETYFPELKGRVFHVHGDHSNPHALLLPSEVAFESYYDHALRTEALARHKLIMDVIDKADALVIYGLSLSPLDAELSQLINAGLYQGDGESTKRVEIVDIDPKAVANRLRSVLQGKPPVIHCWIPPHPAP